MIDCRQLMFSPMVGAERRTKAEMALGESVVTKTLGVALYWLGAKRGEIAAGLGVPENSLRTTVRVVRRDGLGGLEDRRRRSSQGTFLAPAQPPRADVSATVTREGDLITVRFGAMTTALNLSASKAMQARVVLLSLVHSGVISVKGASEALGLSCVHVRNLSARLNVGDVEALQDQRRGQQQSHVLTPEVKSQIVLQYLANAVTGQSTVSRVVAANVEERCGLEVSDRTLRHCIAKLGLGRVGKALPELVERIKKGSGA